MIRPDDVAQLHAVCGRLFPDQRLDADLTPRELAMYALSSYGVDGSKITSSGQRLDDRSDVFVVAFALAKDKVERAHADRMARLAGKPAPTPTRADAIDDEPTPAEIGAARRALQWRADMSDAAREELARKNAREAAWRRNFAARTARPAPNVREDGGASYRARQRDVQAKTRETRRSLGAAPLPNSSLKGDD